MPRETVRIVREFKETGKVPNVVNLARTNSSDAPSGCSVIWIVPACWRSVLDAIKSEHINVQEMENIVFEGAEAAVARINLDKRHLGLCWMDLRAGECRRH